jgi:hypothetical protein
MLILRAPIDRLPFYRLVLLSFDCVSPSQPMGVYENCHCFFDSYKKTIPAPDFQPAPVKLIFEPLVFQQVQLGIL